MADPTLNVEPLVAYPKLAQVGRKYLLTVDLQWDPCAENWPFADEEYPVHCMVDPQPLFTAEPIGTPSVVLHRFGATYGPARFVLTPVSQLSEGKIRIHLINGRGKLVRTFHLDGIRMSLDAVPVPISDAATVLSTTTIAPDLERFVFLSDLEPTDVEMTEAPISYRRYRNSDGMPIHVAGHVYENGVTMSVPGQLEYNLNGEFDQFTGTHLSAFCEPHACQTN